MSELTPEEKRKIYEEEKARHEARDEINQAAKQKANKRAGKQMGIGCLIVLILAILGGLWFSGFFNSCGQKTSFSPEKESAKVQKESLEYKLATIEKGYVSRDDILITRFKNLLEQLDEKYAENKQEISDMTVKAQAILRDRVGVKESLLNIMEGMNKLFSSKTAQLKYSEYTSAYMALRTKGYSHDKATEGLRAILQDLGIY